MTPLLLQGGSCGEVCSTGDERCRTSHGGPEGLGKHGLSRFSRYILSGGGWVACERTREPGQARKGAAVTVSLCDTFLGRRFTIPRP
jgi:hypothetical protein